MDFGEHWGMKTPLPILHTLTTPQPGCFGQSPGFHSLSSWLLDVHSVLPSLAHKLGTRPKLCQPVSLPQGLNLECIASRMEKDYIYSGRSVQERQADCFLLPKCPEVPWFLFLRLFWFSTFLSIMEASPYLLQTSPLCLRWVNLVSVAYNRRIKVHLQILIWRYVNVQRYHYFRFMT